MKKIISEINKNLLQKTKINPHDICICGFSGGQDSVLLFIILLHLKKQWNIQIQALHFHHFWQEKNFFSTYQVWKLNFVFKIPFYFITSEVFLETEKTARHWRQKGLERISNLEKSNTILTGHTASDRIETALWHLIRGTSPQGFISLKWQTTLLTETEFFTFPKFFNLFQNKKKSNKSPNVKASAIYVPNAIVSATCVPSTNVKAVKAPNAIAVSNRVPIRSFCVNIKNIYYNQFTKSKIKSIYKKPKNKKTLKSSVVLFRFPKTLLVSFSFSKNWVFVTNEFFQKQKEKQKEKKCVLLKKYKKNNIQETQVANATTLGPSFLFFNYYILNTILLKKQQRIYCFLNFNFVFYKKDILRPLLALHRNDIIFFSKKYLLPIVCDPTNEKLRWSRNRIRNQLFPLLRIFFNPNTEYLLNNYLEISIEEQKYIEYLIQKIIKYWLKKYKNDSDIKSQLQFFPKAIQRRLLEKIFQFYTQLQPTLLQIELLRININKNV